MAAPNTRVTCPASIASAGAPLPIPHPRWEFDKDGQSFSVQVDPQITTNDPRFMLRSALAHAGITFAFDETFHAHVNRGEFVLILEAYMEPFPGFLYFPARRHMAPKLRAFIEYLRATYS